MSQYCILIAKYLGWPKTKLEKLLFAAPMHDIGKLGIPDNILLKKEKLTPEERKIMEQYSEIGANILKNSQTSIIQMSEVITLTHHEKWDGTGYPRNLKGNDIPIEGRICAIADVFDALSSKRVYKDPWPLDKVIKFIDKNKGIHFDPELVDIFLSRIDDVIKIQKRYKEKSLLKNVDPGLN